MSIIAQIVKNSLGAPSKIAIQDKNSSISYEQFVTDIRAVAALLKANDVSGNDNVLLHAASTYPFICLYFAVHLLGARTVPIATDSDENYKNYVLKKVEPKFIIEDPKAFFDQIGEDSGFAGDDSRSDDLADLVFTSGTTGEPKGVALKHSQLLAATEHIIKEVTNTSDDVELLLMPLSHSFGLGRMRTTLYAGGTLVIGYPLQRLKGVFKAMKEHRVTGLGFVPSAWEFITKLSANLITNYAAQLHYIEMGSAYFSEEQKQQMVEWFPDTHIVMHYGLTEVSRAVFIQFHNDPLGAVGNNCRGAEVKILDSDGNLLDGDGEGEIVLKAPWMMTEYYLNPSVSAESYVDGFFKTGDTGRVSDGFLYYTGRLKEIINVGGKKVSPYQVEAVLLGNPGIKECACASCPDEFAGEVIKAFLVLNKDFVEKSDKVIEDVRAMVQESLPTHMRPKYYQIIEQLPKTASGKVQRLKLTTEA